MRDKRLDEELPEDTLDVLDLLFLGGTLSNPRLCFRPGLVEGKKTALASPLDQLIWLGDELGAGNEEPWVGDLGLVEDVVDILVIGKVQRRKLGSRVVGC